jgi:hypothetical protein
MTVLDTVTVFGVQPLLNEVWCIPPPSCTRYPAPVADEALILPDLNSCHRRIEICRIACGNYTLNSLMSLPWEQICTPITCVQNTLVQSYVFALEHFSRMSPKCDIRE